MNSVDYVEHLRQQMRLLQGSCDSYDKGLKDAALDIAVRVRVMFHDTSKSISLLSRLEPPTFGVLSTVRKQPPGATILLWNSALSIQSYRVENGRAKMEWLPALESAAESAIMPRNEWWNQVFCVLNEGPIRRRDLVLVAANKDGGAHVDDQLPGDYEALKKGSFASLFQAHGGDTTEQTLASVHLSDLRQIGYEVINTADILARAR